MEVSVQHGLQFPVHLGVLVDVRFLCCSHIAINIMRLGSARAAHVHTTNMAVDDVNVKYTLWGFGFSGFGQLCSQSDPEISFETRSGKAASDGVELESKRRDCSVLHSELATCYPHKLMEFGFSSKPSLQCSTAWDALHVHVCEDRKDGLAANAESHSKSFSMTTGRWAVAFEKVKQQLNQEELVCILETRDALLFQTATRTLIAKQDPKTGKWHLTECGLSNIAGLGSLSDGSLFVHLEPGDVHHFSVETHSDLPSLKLGPQINPGVQVTALSCGIDHVLLLAANGNVYSLGLGTRGQLGHGDVLPRKEPCLIEALAGMAVRELSCGSWHSLALSEYGDVYSWGWNEHGQLGHSTEANTPVVPLPKLISTAEDDLNFVSVGCGSRHSAAVTDSGSLYAWGWNGYGQVGCGELGRTVTQPSLVCFPDARVKPMAVYCGHWNTFVLCTS